MNYPLTPREVTLTALEGSLSDGGWYKQEWDSLFTPTEKKSSRRYGNTEMPHVLDCSTGWYAIKHFASFFKKKKKLYGQIKLPQREPWEPTALHKSIAQMSQK